MYIWSQKLFRLLYATIAHGNRSQHLMCGRIVKGKGSYFKLNVHIPLKLARKAVTFQMSLPLCNYTHVPAANWETLVLHARLHRWQFPTHWSLVTISTSMENNLISLLQPLHCTMLQHNIATCMCMKCVTKGNNEDSRTQT